MVTKWETFYLLVVTLPIMGHVVLLPMVINIAGRDSWMSSLIAFMIGIIYVWILYHLRSMYPKGSVRKSINLMLGNLMARLTFLTLMIYFIFLTALSISSLVDMVNVVFLPETPLWALIISFLILSMYGATKDVKGIALTAGIVLFVVMFTGHSITFINFRDRDLFDILPLLEYGWKPVFIGAILLSNVWIEMLFLLVIPLKNNQEKGLLIIWIIGVFANVIMMLSTMSGTIMTFGLGQAEQFIYPALEIIRIIDIDFIDRLDVYALILMMFGSYIRGSLFFIVGYQQIKNLIPSSRKWIDVIWFILLGIIVGILTYIMGETRMRFETSLVVYSYTIFLFIFSLLMLVISKIRKKQKYY